MKKFIALTMATAFSGFAIAASQDFASDKLKTRSLRANQATSTASPTYADEEMNRELRSADSDEGMEQREEFRGSVDSSGPNEIDRDGVNTRTYKANHAIDFSDSY